MSYLYAIWVPRAACTYRIQQVAEAFETGTLEAMNWRDPERFAYNPRWSDNDNASCVWQFSEYAVHEVPAKNILASWRSTRMILVRMRDDERVQAGIRFKLDKEVVNLGSPLGLPIRAAKVIARPYTVEYPRKYGEFLSYWGTVRASIIPCSSKDLAERTVRQLDRILVADEHGWSVREDGVTPSENVIRLR